MLSGANMMMWRAQAILHKHPQVVPGTLFSISGSLVVYRHLTHQGDEHEDVLKTFLAMILIQMIPLAVLEMKIMSCADPVGLFCKFAMPVTLMHTVFLGLRLVHYNEYEQYTLRWSTIGLVGSLITIVFGYRQNLAGALACRNVWSTIALAFLAAFGAEALSASAGAQFTWSELIWRAKAALHLSNNYIEITAFVPAVVMVFLEGSRESKYKIESAETKRVSTAFFLFLVGFYILEDLGNAHACYSISRLASVAHLAHFALLVDFACYVLAHIYNPDKLVGELRRWLPFDMTGGMHEV
jgi:hypothetical protein